MVYIKSPYKKLISNYCYGSCFLKSCGKVCTSNCGRVCVVDCVVNEGSGEGNL